MSATNMLMAKVSIVRESLFDVNIESLKKKVSEYSTESTFEDDSWLLDKLRRSIERDGELRINYISLSKIHHELLKYHTLLQLGKHIGIKSIKNQLTSIKTFFTHIEEHIGISNLNHVTRAVLISYEKYVFSLDITYKAKRKKMAHVNEFINNVNGYNDINMYSNYKNQLLVKRDRVDVIKSKYILDEITSQMDNLFKNNPQIELHFKLVYWICRSIPSRISEVCSMELDCLKPSFTPNSWVLYIPTWKTSGNYQDAELRAIHIQYDGHGKYLIDLVREQQAIAKGLQDFVTEEEKNFLFTYVYKKSSITNLCQHIVQYHFNKFCKKFNIVDSKNEVYKFTSHQLRHNGITDRVYEGFNLIEIRDMTAHKGDAMIVNSYIHTDDEKLKDKQKSVLKDSESKEDNKILFRGRILNMNEAQERLLLSSKRAFSLGKIGICSDTSRCQNKTLFMCFDDCEHFIPDAESLDYFKSELNEWAKKIVIFEKHPFMKEHSEHNYNLFKKIVDKIYRVIGD